ncbi:hypothetical protein JMJ35_009970 [Cladonia borealis]|uniref:Uncharacterized protein n=1 Tax=Cladonia borealis TaxID=184061 RepID=A0AA39UXK6_9LECA|nr:hypothetical protein JMJ35_009970 [Cladonia borealis]
MPAPLAKGLLISLSFLFAAGLAAYENPHVRQWIDESRRKVAMALHSLGDEVAPPSQSRDASPDASTRESEDPEAVERRRKARQEILERGRMLEERRRSKQPASPKAKSFDELVDQDGTLKTEETSATTTAAEPQEEDSGLRHRHVEAQAAALGSSFANPFTDEMHIDPPAPLSDSMYDISSPPTIRNASISEPPSRSQTPTLPISPASPPIPPKPAAYQPQRILVNTDPLPNHPPSPQTPRLLIDTDNLSNHPSEQLLYLTPTTSASSFNTDLAELNDPNIQHQPAQSSYWSVNEWAENNARATPFYSPPASEVQRMGEHTGGGEQADTGEHASQMGSEDLDVISEDGRGVNTPGSWTDVGSQVSEDY